MDARARITRKIVAAAAIGYLVVTASMTVTAGAGAPPAGATEAERIAAGVGPLALAGFAFATAIAPFMLALLAGSVLLAVPRERRPLGLVGVAIAVAYAPLSSAAYLTQYTVVPGLLRAGEPAGLWSFNAAGSVTMALDLLGYALWGAGACLVAAALIPAGRAWRWGGWALIASGLLSVAAFPLHVVGAPGALAASAASGGISLVFAVAALVEARRPESLSRPPETTG